VSQTKAQLLDGKVATIEFTGGSALTPSITFTGDANTGLYSTGADQIAFTTGGTQRLLIDGAGQIEAKSLGSASAPTWSFVDDPNTGIYSPGADQVAISTNGTGRLFIDSSGRVGIGTNSVSTKLHIVSNGAGGDVWVANGSGQNCLLEMAGNGNTPQTNSALYGQDSSNNVYAGWARGAHPVLFGTNGTERGRWDSSGRFLVGTSSAPTGGNAALSKLHVAGNTSGNIGVLSIGSTLPTASVGNGVSVGILSFSDASAGEYGYIACQADGTTGTNDFPGRIVLATTADGASSPTERMRINSSGTCTISNSSYLQPATDNAVYLGGGTNLRWIAVYAANGTIQTSDARQKTEIVTSSLGVDFVKSLRPVSYKFIVGGNKPTGETDSEGNWIYQEVPGKRTHWGFVAQEVKEAVDAAGVDFGGWILDDPSNPDSDQGLRYDQFIAPLTKALQEALAKIEILEAKVAALESA
jgi:hypothetical protein